MIIFLACKMKITEKGAKVAKHLSHNKSILRHAKFELIKSFRHALVTCKHQKDWKKTIKGGDIIFDIIGS